MRFYFHSTHGDWHDFYDNVVNVRRLSTTKWEITYRIYDSGAWTAMPRYEMIMVIADEAWCEVRS